jgi:hypothetical protein
MPISSEVKTGGDAFVETNALRQGQTKAVLNNLWYFSQHQFLYYYNRQITNL